MNKGKLFILSGQSGVGKNTIAKGILDNSQIRRVITCTTRKPRPHETEGKDYLFLSEYEFSKKISSDYFLEYAKVHNWHYGTPKTQVEAILNSGLNALIIIDVQGAMQIKEEIPEAVLIFIKYESCNIEEIIKERIASDPNRNMTEVEILKRIESAKKEAECIKFYNYSVVNHEDRPEIATAEINHIIMKEINKN